MIIEYGLGAYFEPHALPPRSLGGLIDGTTKTVGKGDKAHVKCDEAAVRKIARKTASGKASEVNQWDMSRILPADPGIVRRLSRARMLALKRHTGSQIQPAEDFARVTAARLSASLMELRDFANGMNTAAQAKFGPEFKKKVDAVIEEFHKTYPSPIPQSKGFYENLQSIVKSFEGTDKDLVTSAMLSKCKKHIRENAHAVAQLEQVKFYHKNATIIGHLARHSGHDAVCRIIPPGWQKGGMNLLNAFGMITMVASTPLMYMSFKQMYDAMRDGPQQQS